MQPSFQFRVPESAPREDKAVAGLINQGLRPLQLLRAAWTAYRFELELELAQARHALVRDGLFAGLQCNTSTLASVLLAKVNGTYEAELQDLLRRYAPSVDAFIDIGCAEGYYVNGMAHWRRIPAIGVDINPASQPLLLETARVNGLESLAHAAPSVSAALAQVGGDVMVLVDVDGAERLVLAELSQALAQHQSITSVTLAIETDAAETGRQNTPELVDVLLAMGFALVDAATQDPLRRFAPHNRGLSFLEQCVQGLEGRPAGQMWLVAQWRRP